MNSLTPQDRGCRQSVRRRKKGHRRLLLPNQRMQLTVAGISAFRVSTSTRSARQVIRGVLAREYVMRDNDAKFSAQFDGVLTSSGAIVKRNTALSPNLWAHVERFIQTLKFECLNKFVIVAEKHSTICAESGVAIITKIVDGYAGTDHSMNGRPKIFQGNRDSARASNECSMSAQGAARSIVSQRS